MARKIVLSTLGLMETIVKGTDLTYWGADDILRLSSIEVSEADFKEGTVQKIAQKLERNLQFYRDRTGVGRGIAAPQVGENLRMVTIFTDGKFLTLVNPLIKQASAQKAVYREGCLSSLPLTARVVRPYLLVVEYTSLSGEVITKDCNEVESRLLGHELDHLDGIWFADKAEPGTIKMVYNLKDLLQEKLEKV